MNIIIQNILYESEKVACKLTENPIKENRRENYERKNHERKQKVKI